MSELPFTPFPKIARLNRGMTITEKIDGTNSAVIIAEIPQLLDTLRDNTPQFQVWAQSRNRVITPDNDNFGFAQWVEDNREELINTLGVGTHFGEWWGSGIQRGYGLLKGEKRFSLFNTTRWVDTDFSAVPGLGMVPVLWEGGFDTNWVHLTLQELERHGSYAAPGFMKPEGVVVFHHAANHLYKVTVENDEIPKALAGGK